MFWGAGGCPLSLSCKNFFLSQTTVKLVVSVYFSQVSGHM